MSFKALTVEARAQVPSMLTASAEGGTPEEVAVINGQQPEGDNDSCVPELAGEGLVTTILPLCRSTRRRKNSVAALRSTETSHERAQDWKKHRKSWRLISARSTMRPTCRPTGWTRRATRSGSRTRASTTRWTQVGMAVIGAYVDDLLTTGATQERVDRFSMRWRRHNRRT